MRGRWMYCLAVLCCLRAPAQVGTAPLSHEGVDLRKTIQKSLPGTWNVMGIEPVDSNSPAIKQHPGITGGYTVICQDAQTTIKDRTSKRAGDSYERHPTLRLELYTRGRSLNDAAIKAWFAELRRSGGFSQASILVGLGSSATLVAITDSVVDDRAVLQDVVTALKLTTVAP